MRDSLFDALTQWCLVFPRPLSQIDIFDSTLCTLHARIVWQNLESFLAEDFDGTFAQEQALEDMGADGAIVQGGILCSLGDLRKGKVNARLVIEFSPKNKQQKVVRNVQWQDNPHTPLKPWLKILQKQVHNRQRPDSNVISLADSSKRSGYSGESCLKFHTALATARGVSAHEVPLNHAYRFLVRRIVAKKEFIGHGSSVKVVLYNEKDELLNSGTLTQN